MSCEGRGTIRSRIIIMEQNCLPLQETNLMPFKWSLRRDATIPLDLLLSYAWRNAEMDLLEMSRSPGRCSSGSSPFRRRLKHRMCHCSSYWSFGRQCTNGPATVIQYSHMRQNYGWKELPSLQKKECLGHARRELNYACNIPYWIKKSYWASI